MDTGPVIGVIVVAALVVAPVVGLWLVQRRMIYFPDRAPVPPAATILPGGEDVVLHTSDGLRLTAWLFRPTGPNRNIAVLVAPGNAGNRLGRVPLARALVAAGYTVLLMDYRGYGGNPGRPSEPAIARDVRAARSVLLGDGFTPDRIVYFGESLGAAVATELATDLPPAGLVLRSPFVDLAAVGRHHYPVLPVRMMLRDRYPVSALIGGVTAPTAVIYGTADSVVPPSQSRDVAARARNLTRVIAVGGADHNDPAFLDGAPVVDAINEVAGGVL